MNKLCEKGKPSFISSPKKNIYKSTIYLYLVVGRGHEYGWEEEDEDHLVGGDQAANDRGVIHCTETFWRPFFFSLFLYLY